VGEAGEEKKNADSPWTSAGRKVFKEKRGGGLSAAGVKSVWSNRFSGGWKGIKGGEKGDADFHADYGCWGRRKRTRGGMGLVYQADAGARGTSREKKGEDETHRKRQRGQVQTEGNRRVREQHLVLTAIKWRRKGWKGSGESQAWRKLGGTEKKDQRPEVLGSRRNCNGLRKETEKTLQLVTKTKGQVWEPAPHGLGDSREIGNKRKGRKKGRKYRGCSVRTEEGG